jgi:DNA-binding transcriptional LysR family regulator
MNLHLLRLFVAVARHQSFSRAAEALHVSQPAASRGVRELESQLGNPLIERGSGGFSLTESGQVLLGHARALFAAEQAAEEALDAMRGLHRGTLRIGASKTVATYFLPSYLGSFSRMHPAIELRLISANTLAITETLMSRDLDVAIVEGPVKAPELIVKPWQEDELVFIVGADHPLNSTKMSVPIEALTNETIILREPGSGTRDVAWSCLCNAGINPRRTLEVSDNEAITRVVAAGLGIGIVSAVVAADQIALGRLKKLRVREVTISRTLSRLFIPGRQPSPASAAFEHLLDKE